MELKFHNFIIFLILLTIPHSSAAAFCNQTCGARKLPFPFGFSADCQIQLNCTANDTILAADFPVQSVEAGTIVVNLPAVCRRPVAALHRLFTGSFAPTSQNAILLHDCRNASSACLIPWTMVQTHFEQLDCDGDADNATISCYSETDNATSFIDYENLTRSGCRSLFSSISMEADTESSSVSLDVQVVKLGWWLRGECQCSRNAKCILLSPPRDGGSLLAYRCECNEGFAGDGFIDGVGCWKEAAEKPKAKWVNKIYAAAGSVFAVIMGVLIVLIYRRRQHKVKKEPPYSTAAKSSWSTTTSSGTDVLQPYKSCRYFSLHEIQTATRSFDRNSIIGKGGFGCVYRGSMDSGATTVAIKRLNPSSEQGAREFLTEIQMLSKLRHLHLVSLIGYCDKEGEMILVYDYMAHGSLRDHLYGNVNPPLLWKQRLQICMDSAKGLHYLHTGTEHAVIHRDVKSTNILLDENWVAKISDFGLSKMGQQATDSFSHISTNVKGTFGYLDPKYLSTHQLTRKSDVYAFGVVLFEVLSGRAAVDVRLEEEQHSLAGWARYCVGEGQVDRLVDEKLVGQISAPCLQVFVGIAGRCIHIQPLERPTMADVVMGLQLALGLQDTSDSVHNEDDHLLINYH